MNGVAILSREMREIQSSLLRELEPLQPEHVLYSPAEGATTIGFIAWHVARALDTAVHVTMPVQSQPTIWEAQRLYERFGLSLKDSGTGFTPEQVIAFRPTLEMLRAYVTDLAPVIPAAFEGLTDDDLDRSLDPERPERTVARNLQTFVIGHTFSHLGEIRYLKGLQGMPFPL